jgi:glycosyltransferase involved in cell wall biosynthesis
VNILHVITTLDVGGAEMHLLAQVRGQRARGHAVRVAYMKGRGSLAADITAAGAESVSRVGSGAALPWRLRRHIAWADLVHSHLLKADMATAAIATSCGARMRLVSSKHNDEQVLKRSFVGFVHGLLGNLPQRTIVLSDHVGRFIAEHGRVKPDRLRRIYYGIDPAPFERAASKGRDARDALRASFGFGADDVVLVCVARFAPQKAHDVLLRAFARARESTRESTRELRGSPGTSGTELKLLLVGDDPFGDGRQRTEALARELDLGSACVFTGVRRDVPDLMAASDVFVMSSLWEGLGLVFLEAMATGLPVVSTRVSAIPEVVVDGETGLLVPPADDAALADALVRLAREPALRARLGAAGRARVRERFGLERMIDETLAVYAEVLATGALQSPAARIR